MPNWSDILREIQVASAQGGPLDVVRRKHIKNFHQYRKRNVICYYSGWLQRPNFGNTEINDVDKNAFMNAVHGLDFSKGLDLILHTPGGQVAATESLVGYLRKVFKNDIVAFIPQIALSAGTMIACACTEIVMGKQSSLGPTDPQFNGIPAAGVLEEFRTAMAEIAKNPSSIPIWQAIIGKYHPTFLLECINALNWSKQLVTDWLATGMFVNDPNPVTTATNASDILTNYALNKSHFRHLDLDTCEKIVGLKIVELEKNQKLQDLLLSVHHSYMHTFSSSPAVKIIENHKGQAMVIMGEQR